MTIFSWPPPPPSSGATGGNSSGLETTGAPVDVSGAAPPVAGQVLTAIDATHAQWRVAGLKYDPAIRFNVNAGGVATIEPGTWGFVYTTPVGATEITIFVVSSLTAPPVDSRFGLYVSPSVTLPVTVSLIGASQIMGVDGTLSTTADLLPGAMYEWVFYHEDSAAIWGLVSHTINPLRTLADAVSNALPVDFVLSTNQVLNGNSGNYDGVPVASDQLVLLTGQTDRTQNGFWQTHDAPWTRPAGYPDPPDVNQGAYIRNGNTQTGAVWAHLGNNAWELIEVGHGTLGVGALHAVATSTTAGFLSSADKSKLDTLSYDYKDACAAVARTSITLSGAQTIDGTPVVVGERVLCTAQASQVNNGIYIVAAGAWTRAPDADNGTKVTSGMLVPITRGTANAQTLWMLTQIDPIVVGTSALPFLQITATAGALRVGGANTVTTPTAQPSIGQVMVATPTNSALTWQTVQEPGLNGFRLSVDNADGEIADASYATIFAVPVRSNQICLWNGAVWQMFPAAGAVSLAISGRTANLPFDIFAAPNVSTFTLEVVNWSTSTARATALAKKDGVWVKSGDNTRRYLGTALPDSTTTVGFQRNQGVAGGAAATWGLWNVDNRRLVALRSADASSSWTYNSATWRQANNPATDVCRSRCVIGLDLDPIDVQIDVFASSDTAANQLGVAIGTSPTTPLTDAAGGLISVPASNALIGLHARHTQFPTTIGLRNFYWLEKGAATGTNTFYGAATDKQSQMITRFFA